MPRKVDEKRQLFSRGYSQHFGTVHPKMKILTLILTVMLMERWEKFGTPHIFKEHISNIAVFSLTTEVAGDLL